MGFENLSEFETKLYEYIKANDFQTKKWSTRDVARALHSTEDDIYKGLANLSKEIRDNIWIYYENGGIRIVAE
jgi:hypothetical protein